MRLAIDLDARHAARLRSGGDDDLLSSRPASACRPSVTSTLPSPARRPLPLIQAILFFLNSSSMPPVSPLTILSLRACTCAMSRPIAGPEPCRAAASPIVSPHSFQDCATFSACACSSSALVGMQPQFRQVPPSTGARSTTAVRQAELGGADGGDVAAGAGADDDHVVFAEPWARYCLLLHRRQRDERHRGAAAGPRPVRPARVRPARDRAARPASAGACSRTAVPSTTGSACRASGQPASRQPARRARPPAPLRRQSTQPQPIYLNTGHGQIQ